MYTLKTYINRTLDKIGILKYYKSHVLKTQFQHEYFFEQKFEENL